METPPEVARQLARAERSKRRQLNTTPFKACRKERICVPHFKNTPVSEGDASCSTSMPWFYVNKSGALASRTADCVHVGASTVRNTSGSESSGTNTSDELDSGIRTPPPDLLKRSRLLVAPNAPRRKPVFAHCGRGDAGMAPIQSSSVRISLEVHFGAAD